VDEKERIEREALSFFLQYYNQKRRSRFKLLRKRERPDFEIRNQGTGKTLGVEICHIFHDKKEAMMMLGRDPSNFHGIINTADHAKVVNYVLKKKAFVGQFYDCDHELILVIRDFSKLFDVHTLMKYKVGFKVPKCRFKEIWYLSRSTPEHSWDQLVRLK